MFDVIKQRRTFLELLIVLTGWVFAAFSLFYYLYSWGAAFDGSSIINYAIDELVLEFILYAGLWSLAIGISWKRASTKVRWYLASLALAILGFFYWGLTFVLLSSIDPLIGDKTLSGRIWVLTHFFLPYALWILVMFFYLAHYGVGDAKKRKVQASFFIVLCIIAGLFFPIEFAMQQKLSDRYSREESTPTEVREKIERIALDRFSSVFAEVQKVLRTDPLLPPLTVTRAGGYYMNNNYDIPGINQSPDIHFRVQYVSPTRVPQDRRNQFMILQESTYYYPLYYAEDRLTEWYGEPEHIMIGDIEGLYYSNRARVSYEGPQQFLVWQREGIQIVLDCECLLLKDELIDLANSFEPFTFK